MPTRLNFLPQRQLKRTTRNEVGGFADQADCHVIAGGSSSALRKRSDTAGRKQATCQRQFDDKPERRIRPGALSHSFLSLQFDWLSTISVLALGCKRVECSDDGTNGWPHLERFLIQLRADDSTLVEDEDSRPWHAISAIAWRILRVTQLGKIDDLRLRIGQKRE